MGLRDEPGTQGTVTSLRLRDKPGTQGTVTSLRLRDQPGTQGTVTSLRLRDQPGTQGTVTSLRLRDQPGTQGTVTSLRLRDQPGTQGTVTSLRLYVSEGLAWYTGNSDLNSPCSALFTHSNMHIGTEVSENVIKLRLSSGWSVIRMVPHQGSLLSGWTLTKGLCH